MSYVTQREVQTWLERTRLTVQVVDPNLESTAFAICAGYLNQHDSTLWVDAASTPLLVRKIIAMLVAAYVYMIQYGEDSDSTFGKTLESSAMELLGGLADGSIQLTDVNADRDPTSYPTFFPTDAATTLFETDPTDPGGAPRAFTMGKVF